MEYTHFVSDHLLFSTQESNVVKANLIEENLELVQNAITLIRDCLSSSMDWAAIEKMLKDAQEDPETDPDLREPAKAIRKLDLHYRHIFLYLT